MSVCAIAILGAIKYNPKVIARQHLSQNGYDKIYILKQQIKN